jgi:tetratricopeptide (TPR) repeat protein
VARRAVGVAQWTCACIVKRVQRTQTALALVLILLFGAAGRARAAEALALESDETLFCVMAAINAAGYDEGLNLPDNSPLRKQLRDYLASQHIAVLPELKQYYRRHMQKNGLQDLSQFTSFAFSVTGPPDFGWKSRDVDIPPDALALDGFQPLMIDFFNQANLGELWKRVQPEYDKEIARYHTPILNMTGSVDGYLRDSPLDFPGRHFHAIVELLTAPELIQTRNYGDEAYVVISPSAQPRMYDIRHSYLHFEIDPVMLTYRANLQQKRSMLDLVQTAPLDDNYKTDFVLLANESLIKAVEARLDKDGAAIERATKQGYIMTPFFGGQLPVFENQPQGLRYYADVMIDAIDLQKETERLSTVKFDSALLQRVAKQVTVAGPELSAAGKALEKAESLYTDRNASPDNLNQAKALFNNALELKGEPAEHAQAWYGLARIAVLENRGEIAIQLFQKTLESSPDDFTRGWANVYLGRLSKAQHEFTQAAKYYQDALAVSGASDKAKQSATSELQQISNNQEKQTQ